MSIGRRNDLEFDIEVLLTFEPEKVVRVNKEYRPGPYGASWKPPPIDNEACIPVESLRILRSRKLLDYSHDDGSGSYSGVLYSYVLTSVRVYNIDYAGLRAELGIENRLPQESDNIKNLEIKTNNRKIVFNEKNGDVFLNGKFLCSIRPRTRQYYFFLFLYQNSPEYRSYEEIVGYIVAESKSIDGKGRSEEEFSSYLSGIKNDLPKEIRKYIENGKHSYRLSEAKKPMKKGRKSREKRR